MPPKREVKDLYFDTDAYEKVMAGAYKCTAAVSSVYGPGAGNALLGMPYGDPTLTRDGVTVAKRVSLADRAEDEPPKSCARLVTRPTRQPVTVRLPQSCWPTTCWRPPTSAV